MRVPLADHFKGKPKAFALFKAFRKTVEDIGPVRLVSSKSRIAFMVRVRFAGCTVRKQHLRAGMWLPYPVDSPKVVRKEFVPPHYYLLSFDIREPEDLDGEFRRLLREAYHLGGLQEHLKLRIKN